LIHIKATDDLSGTIPRSAFSKSMRNVARRRAAFAFVLCLVIASFGCGRADKSGTDTRHYEARAIVRALPPDHKTIDLEHEDIPGFMPSMRMPFEVRDEKEIADLKLDDAIAFRLNVTQLDSWIDHVRKIDSGELHLPRRAPTSPSQSETAASERLHEGDPMSDFTLTDQDGKPVTLETFRGHPFVVTFIFTRCPLPNFCPRMSQNFAELQKAIQTSSGPLASTRLLSISFDPEHDTPEVLREYARHDGADFATWTFATGTTAEIRRLTKTFSVLVQPESGTISHSLATALIDRDGKIAKIWRGNSWTPAEVMSELTPRP
jgi:protein SCO1/2